MENLEFMKKFRPNELCVREFKYWIVCVRQKQPTLGDVVILLKRETENVDRKSTRLNSSHIATSRMPSSA